MTPEQLKASILQYAIQGKLVEQREEEGTTDELYQQIQEEKQKLIKEGKIKKEKPLDEITEDEIPFDIPESWKWVRLRNICTKIVDGDHNPPAGIKEPTEYVMLSATNINKNTIVDLDKVRYLTKEDFIIENQRTKVKINDIFFTIVGSMGRSCVYKGGLNVCFQRSVSVLTTLIYPEYLKYMLDSPFVQSFMYINSTGTAQKGFYLKQLENLIVALPPLAEQHRIVAKIEELMPFVDRYAASYEQLEQLNTKFPGDMKKSILQYAIQGKLVEQRPEEGTAEELYQQIQEEKQKLIKEGKIKKEKPLPEITEDEIPFDIPESWKWVRLGDLSELITKGSSPKWQGVRYVENGLLFITSENVGKNKLIWNNKKYVEEKFDDISPRSSLKKDDLLTNIVGASIGRTAIYDIDEKANINQAVCLIRLINKQLLNYILYYMNSYVAYSIMMGDKVDTARANISLTNIANFIIPLPPLAEQHRIVTKLEELLPYCDRLE